VTTSKPLEGLRVIDCATLFAGPLIATFMGDFGADVIKVEHPRGDPLRSWGARKDGVPLWWTVVSRNKRCVTLDLSSPHGRQLFLQLAADADVVIENFRPGTLERWGLGPDVLREANRSLVVVRTTCYGQTGPYASRPGFGTLAEAMSGFAHINGWPDKPPALPPFALADGVAGLTGCFAAMFALWWRDHGGEGSGQIIDLSIFEPLFWILGPHAVLYDQLGTVQERTGNATPLAAPRNAYETKDGVWLALSASTPTLAERVMRIVGGEHLIEEPWFSEGPGRVEHAAELDAYIAPWIAARTSVDVMKAFADAEGAIAPMYSISDIFLDPQYLARDTIATVDHPQLGPMRMQNVVPSFSDTPGGIDHLGPELGEHDHDVFCGELGLSPETLTELQELGVIAQPIPPPSRDGRVVLSPAAAPNTSAQ
jgi:crotonobetainyl-CoA:carnitine CoA-transferase CaiB-like acyl-CoA transferase